MNKIGMGLIGPGFVAAHHIDAVRRLGDVDVVAIAGSSLESASRKAKEYKVERAYGDFHTLIADPDVQVIHNTTPNYLHLPVTMAPLKADKHVISAKPLALNPEEGRKLRDAAVAAKVGNVVTFSYRGNPLVQQARGMIVRGETEGLSFVRGQYSILGTSRGRAFSTLSLTRMSGTVDGSSAPVVTDMAHRGGRSLSPR